ncbi:MAG: putative 4-hydroxybenzoate polyprenyltransferase [Armatimonadota bacterium]|nr:putative 4-hydroxybenzoate polyprenyltransferase [Armatimonadota bacterium]
MNDNPDPSPSWFSRLGVILEMIKFQHTVFALPFAVMSAALATSRTPDVSPWVYFWILVAMVGARSSAMAFNRLVDREIDAENPRTAQRALPLGLVTPAQTALFTAGSALLFLFAAYRLNGLAFALSPVALLIILGYSYTKRFTWASHWVLGFALAIAPVGAWIAVTGQFAVPPLLLAAAVACWTAGFDIIYSCQDVDFDSEKNLFSVPRRFGVARALQLSSLFHAIMVLCLAILIPAASLGWVYGAGVAAAAGLLVYEHSLVKPGDLSRVDAAFFTTNGLVSIGLMVFLLADVGLG